MYKYQWVSVVWLPFFSLCRITESIGSGTGGIIWEVEGRGSGGKGVAYHTDSPTQVEDFDLGW